MALGKKKVIVYTDWIVQFKDLTDEEAGRLIKHFFEYVNDLNPKADRLTELLFNPIKATLKRDLIAWEAKQNINRENGLKGGRPKKEVQTEINPKNPMGFSETQTNPKKGVSDSVNVSVKDNVNVSIKNILLSEIEISDVSPDLISYFEISKAFHSLFKKNSELLGVSWSHLEKVKFQKAITPIRLLMEVDKRTNEDIREVYRFLEKDSFWMQNIRSTEKLREKFDTLITQAKNKTNVNPQSYGKQKPIRSIDDVATEMRNRALARFDEEQRAFEKANGIDPQYTDFGSEFTQFSEVD